MGLPVERVAWRAHASCYRRLSSLPPSMAWTLRLLLALHPGCLGYAGTDVGRTQAKRRTSGPCTNASGRLRKNRLASAQKRVLGRSPWTRGAPGMPFHGRYTRLPGIPCGGLRRKTQMTCRPRRYPYSGNTAGSALSQYITLDISAPSAMPKNWPRSPSNPTITGPASSSAMISRHNCSAASGPLTTRTDVPPS